MPKFVLCEYSATHDVGSTWLNLDFVERITETPELIPLGPDTHGETMTRKGDIVLYLSVSGDGTQYKIKDPAWIDLVKSFLAKSFGECSD
jgi:hypothetical protein